jgi:hypothetical protein
MEGGGDDNFLFIVILGLVFVFAVIASIVYAVHH